LVSSQAIAGAKLSTGSALQATVKVVISGSIVTGKAAVSRKLAGTRISSCWPSSSVSAGALRPCASSTVAWP